MSTLFQALQAEKNADDVSVHVKTISTEDLPKDGVLIKVAYSGINYKDGLAGKAGGNIVREYPLILVINIFLQIICGNFLRSEKCKKRHQSLGVFFLIKSRAAE